MMDIKGYDQEEAYFKKKDQELLAKKKKSVFKVGSKVVANPETWEISDFDEWGRGKGTGVVVETFDDGFVDVQWPTGRCYEQINQLLPEPE